MDALQLFVVSRDAAITDGLVSVRLSGKELFAQVAQSTELDGIVFNSCGPTPPVALAREAAQAMLDGD